ncbi:MAG: hypothetical protein CMF96_11455 [Candidatus Marinimicrobia bacterium]|nr:hypothetical protein [Candidatus Neomarinimicrobiota bacterium]
MIITPYKLFLTCPRGFESTCSQELKSLGIKYRKLEEGGVSFKGSIEDIYKVNYLSRTGMILWVEICSIDTNNSDSIYNSINVKSWDELFKTNSTFSFKCIQRSKKFRNTHYIALRGKDAIVDYFKNKKLPRPNVSKVDADLNFLIVIDKYNGKLLLNTSGQALFKRGYRTIKHDAPLNETLASNILKYVGWDKDTPLYDPFCGSGTIAIEAAQIAKNIPAGKHRKKWGFFHFPEFNTSKWVEFKNEADSKIVEKISLEIYGSDINKLYVQSSIIHAKNAGVQNFIKFRNIDIKDWLPFSSNGTIITNPPYGIRLDQFKNLAYLYSLFGDTLKNHCEGFKAFIICGNRELIKSIGLRTSFKLPLRISKLDGRLVGYELYKGKKTF